MRSVHDVPGVVTEILQGNKCVVAFSVFGNSQTGILPSNRLKVRGATIPAGKILTDFVVVGSKVRFSCHEFGSKADHEYDWYITNAWLLNDTTIAGRTAGVFLGLYNCSGKIQYIANRLGILSFKDHTGREHLVLFLASKCYHRGKRINAKQSLPVLLSEDDTVLFDAVPCIPEENEFNCSFFATVVWHQGPRPHDYDTVNTSNCSTSSTLHQYKQMVTCPKSLFKRGQGQVLKIISNEYGIALMAVQNNRWDTVLFHRSCCYLFKVCLATHNLEEIFQEGDKLNIIAVPAPKTMIAQWLAAQVGVLQSIS